jgi:predicted MFS family arabinose efflux permease
LVVVSPGAGWLADRRPRFQLAAVGVLVWSAATFGSGLAPTFAALALARVFTGVGEASYVVVTPSLVSDYYPPERRGRALAVFYAAIPVGSALGFVLGGIINAHFGWRWAFFLAGVPGAALAIALYLLRDPPRGAMDAAAASASPPSLGALKRIPSFLFNTLGQIIYTFVIGGLAVWMPTYFVRVRHLPLASADLMFGGVLAAAGLVGTLIGGKLGDRMAARHPSGHFLLSGASLVLSVPFAIGAVTAPQPAIFWPSMFVALTLMFLNTGPLNAAMANVLPAQLRSWGFGINTMAIHMLGDVPSPTLIGVASDRMGLALPVLVTVTLPALAGLVLLAGRGALARDLAQSGGR